MGSYCKACDNQINEKHNEIIRQSGDLSMSNNTRNNIKESILKVKNDNIKDFIPEIIFLQRKIKKFLSSKHESNQEIFYKKNYSDLNYNQNEEFNIIGYKDENLEGNHLDKNTSKKSDKLKTLSQKYNTLSNHSMSNSKNDGKIYKVEKLQINELAIYSGQMLNGKQHGYGIQEWKDGARYEGEWENGKTNGYGVFYHPEGDIYKGYWKDDKANGKGVYTTNGGIKYDGEWVNDCQEGYGIETWNDGSQYKGYYKNGKKEGYGEYCWSDGSIYVGNWKNNSQEGYGKYIWPDKKSYEGFFKDNALQGKGHYRWPDGRDFIGEFNKGKKHGLGRYLWPDGRIYIGFWENGKQEGLGRYIKGNEFNKFGIWVNGKRNRWLDESTINSLKEKKDEYYQQIIDFDPNNYGRNSIQNNMMLF